MKTMELREKMGQLSVVSLVMFLIFEAAAVVCHHNDASHSAHPLTKSETAKITKKIMENHGKSSPKRSKIS